MTQTSFSLELQPCLRGEEIAKQGPYPKYLSQFRALISAPPDIYAALYLTTLYRFMELCQSLPLASPLKNQTAPSEAYGLLNQAFSVAVAALKIRRGRVMPQHSDSEKIAEQEPRWTYALLTTVLFCSLPAEGFTDYPIGLYKNGQERLGTWHPLTGSLYAPQTFYKIEKNEAFGQAIDGNLLRAAWVGRLIPSIAIRWLADFDDVFSIWWEAVTGSSVNPEQNSLCQYFREAAQKLGLVLEEKKQTSLTLTSLTHTPSENTLAQSAAPSTLENAASPGRTPLNSALKTSQSAEKQAFIRLTQWLNAHGGGDSDSTDLPFLRVKTGVLIEESDLQRVISQYTMYASVDALLTLLVEFLVPDKQSLRVRYRSIQVESREIRRGVVLAEAHLSEKLKQLPMCQDFIPDYSSFHSR